ncbi:hypothetical protein F4810DRAFT_549024 [Camillea tinctor]|nr:hypothetical protein F4810DRAFT_549024 [Camillea tinctor]
MQGALPSLCLILLPSFTTHNLCNFYLFARLNIDSKPLPSLIQTEWLLHHLLFKSKLYRSQGFDFISTTKISFRILSWGVLLHKYLINCLLHSPA